MSQATTFGGPLGPGPMAWSPTLFRGRPPVTRANLNRRRVPFSPFSFARPDQLPLGKSQHLRRGSGFVDFSKTLHRTGAPMRRIVSAAIDDVADDHEARDDRQAQRSLRL